MLLFFALLSTTLQLSVIIISGLTVYNQALSTRIGASSSTYGFPLFSAGTILLVVGMLVCSYTIEQSTIERSWSRKENYAGGLGIIWLQRKQSVNDQSFDPFLIVGGLKNYIITSTRADLNSGDKSQEMTTDHATFVAHVLALSGAILGLVGFFLQFQGMRGLSWPSSVAQLIAIIVMAVIRASVRYSLSRRPQQYSVTETFEMEWLSLRLVLCRKDQFPTPFLRKNMGETTPQLSPKESLFWKISTAENSPSWKPCYASQGTFTRNGEIVATNEGSTEITQNYLCDHEMILKVRQRLGVLAQWEGPTSKDAISLCKAIESVMNHFFPPEPDNNLRTFTWSLKTQIGKDTSSPGLKLHKSIPRHSDFPEGTISFAVDYTEDGWKAVSTAFDAALSLWMSHLQTKQSPNHIDWLRQRAGTEVRYWRVIGDNSDKVLERDLRWWINDALAEEILTRDATREVNGPGGQLLIGFQGFEPIDLVTPQAPSNGFEPIDLITPQAPSNNLSSQKTIPALAIQRSGSLPNALAQHMFSAFMWGLAAEISHNKIGSGRILQSEKFSEANITESWTSPSLQTQELARFAQAVERTGLCSLDEAYISIVPPLSHLQKLPNEVIVNLAREREANRRLDWDETSKIYLDILRHSVVNKPCRYFSSIIAAAIEVLFLVSEPLFDKSDVGKICKEAAELKDALKIMLRKLGPDQETFLNELQFLYKKQGRYLAFEEVLREEAYNTPLSSPDYTIPTEHRSAWWRLTDDHFKAIDPECSTGLKSSESDVFGWTPLHYAVTTGKRKQVIDSRYLPILADMAGRTPVHYAAKCGDHEILENLLGMEIDKKKDAANKIEREGMLPLHLAAQSGHAIGVVKLLLPYTNEINLKDKWGRTALYLAAENGSREIVEILLGKNGNNPQAEINIKCDDRLQQRTALHAAVASKHNSILAILAGMDGRGLNWKDLDQKTALELAVENDCELCIAALVKVFESQDQGRSKRQKSTVIDLDASRFPRGTEIETFAHFTEANDIFTMCHWEEALNLSIIRGRRHALIKMIELSKGYSREETWAHALRVAAKEGKEFILALILGNQEQSKNLNYKKADPLRTSSNIAQQAIHTENYNVSTDAAEGGQKRQLEKVIGSLAKTTEMQSLVNRTNEEGQTPLFLAASNGYVKAVELLLGNKPDLEKVDRRGLTPLNSAAASGYGEVIKTLLAHGANPEAKSRDGRTPLITSIFLGHAEVVQVLLERADMDAADLCGSTPLNVAASTGDLAIVRMLLEKGASLEATNENKWTPLNSAAFFDHVEVVKMLLGKGAYIEAADMFGLTSLNLAAKLGRLEVATALLENQANIEAADIFGLTSLNLATMKGHLAVARMLLEKGAKKDSADENGLTPLHIAAMQGRAEVTEVLLKEEANTEAVDKHGFTPLNLAVRKGHLAVVRMLLEKGANTEAADEFGLTPLNSAANRGHTEIAKVLLEKGANMEAGDEDESTPLNSALRNGHLEVVKILLEKGANTDVVDIYGWTPLNKAAHKGHTEIVKVMLDNGANTEAGHEYGWTPLSMAAQKGHTEIAKVLLENGANTEAWHEYYQQTPLLLAATGGHAGVVQILLEKRANIDVVDIQQWTPLNAAACNGHTEIVKVMLENGANTEAVNEYGCTPLGSAATYGHLEVAKLLLAKGANKEAADIAGLTPLNIAARTGHSEVAEALLAVKANIEAVDIFGSTPLNSAAKTGHLAIVRMLLENGADMEAADEDGLTPLDSAANEGHTDIIKALTKTRTNKEMVLVKRHGLETSDDDDIVEVFEDL